MLIKIGNKEYDVIEAKTQEEKQKGLQEIEQLPENKGMLFYFEPNELVSMTMKKVLFPIDMIFIDDEEEVIHVLTELPGSKAIITVEDVRYVLEVNANSGIKIGDEIEFSEDNGPVMKVLFQDGSELYALWGGERIFSRKNTKILIKKAKKAKETQSDKDYKALGKYMFKCIKIQDERKPEYVSLPNTES